MDIENDLESVLEKKQEEQAIEYFGSDFVENFEKLKKELSQNHTILRIHGTESKENAENIANTGLIIKGAPTLAFTTYTNASYQNIQHWPHKHCNYLILIGLPVETTSGTNFQLDENKEFFTDTDTPSESKPLFLLELNRDLNDTHDKAVYRLPEEFIVGYIDVQSKNIILNPKYKTEHSYDNVYVRDFYLGAQEEADLSLIGDEDELAKRFSEFDKIDKKITPEDRKNATDIIKAEKNDLQKDDDLINSLAEEEWMDF